MSTPSSPPPEGGLKILLLVLSFLIPIAGFIIAILYLQKADEANRAFGKQAAIAACVSIVLVSLVALIGFLMASGAAAAGELSTITAPGTF